MGFTRLKYTIEPKATSNDNTGRHMKMKTRGSARTDLVVELATVAGAQSVELVTEASWQTCSRHDRPSSTIESSVMCRGNKERKMSRMIPPRWDSEVGIE